MSYTATFRKGAAIHPSSFLYQGGCYFYNKHSEHEFVYITVNATGNEYPVKIRNWNTAYTSNSWIVNPPQELIDCGEIFHLPIRAGFAYNWTHTRQVEVTPEGTVLLPIGDMFRNVARQSKVFEHFAFNRAELEISYAPTILSTELNSNTRAIKV